MFGSRRMVVALCLVGLSISAAQAARLLGVRVKQDGKTVLSGMTSDNSEEDSDRVWELLRDVDLEPARPLETDSGDPNSTTLRGTLWIAILHNGRVVSGGRAQANVHELRLVRGSSPTDWRLAPGEVERTRTAAGIPPPRPERWPFVALGLVLVSLLALTVWMLRVIVRARRAG